MTQPTEQIAQQIAQQSAKQNKTPKRPDRCAEPADPAEWMEYADSLETALAEKAAECERLRGTVNNMCPECKNTFSQPFVCTTCGAQKLYDSTLSSAEQRAESEKARADGLRAELDELNKMGGHLYCTTCDSCGIEECCPPSQCWMKRAESAERELAAAKLDAKEKDVFNTSLAMDNKSIRDALTELLYALADMTDLDEMDGEEYWTKSARLDKAETAAKKFTEKAILDAAIDAAIKETK